MRPARWNGSKTAVETGSHACSIASVMPTLRLQEEVRARSKSSAPVQECPIPKNGPGSPPPTGTSTEPAASPRDETLRGQVIEVINDVLADPCPERLWARRQLQELLAAHPEEPERVLLEHLIITRKRTAAARKYDQPAP